MTGNAQMAAGDLDEERIAPGRPDSSDVANGPDQDPDQPELKSEADRTRECAIQNGD